MEEILAIVFIFGGGTVVGLSFSPLGRALAERLRGKRHTPDPEILAELDQLRQDVTEIQERLDFAERLLSREREAGRLVEGGSRE
jgi:hypothetical protein